MRFITILFSFRTEPDNIPTRVGISFFFTISQQHSLCLACYKDAILWVWMILPSWFGLPILSGDEYFFICLVAIYLSVSDRCLFNFFLWVKEWLCLLLQTVFPSVFLYRESVHLSGTSNIRSLSAPAFSHLLLLCP